MIIMDQLWQRIQQILANLLNTLLGRQASATAHTTPIPRYYIVQRGDTLSGIAKRFGTTAKDLGITSEGQRKPGALPGAA